jgi:RHS repeat-associated protein
MTKGALIAYFDLIPQFPIPSELKGNIRMKTLCLERGLFRTVLWALVFGASAATALTQEISCPPSIDLVGLTNGMAELLVSGPAGSLSLEASTNLVNWETQIARAPFSGTLSFLDTNSLGLQSRFYKCEVLPTPPPPIHFSGNTVTLVQSLSGCFARGSAVIFDLNGTGNYSQQTEVDSNGVLTIVLDLTQFQSATNLLYLHTAAGSQTNSLPTLTLVRDGRDNPSEATPMPLGSRQMPFLGSPPPMGVVIALESITTEGGVYRWHYRISIPDGLKIAPTDYGTVNDFAGITNSQTQPVDWQPSSANLGLTPPTVTPTDDANVPNLTWAFNGAQPLVGPTNVEVSALASTPERTLANFTAHAHTHAPGSPSDNTPSDNIGTVAVPGGDAADVMNPGVCACATCGGEGILPDESSAAADDGPGTLNPPVMESTQLIDLQTRTTVQVESFRDRWSATGSGSETAIRSLARASAVRDGSIDFEFKLIQASLVAYDSTVARGWSHSFDWAITLTGPNTGEITTPQQRQFPIAFPNGTNGILPEGWFAQLTIDPAHHRVEALTPTGVKLTFLEAPFCSPGRLIHAQDPNGNEVSVSRDANGLMTSVTTTLGQVETFGYGPDLRLKFFTNHLGQVTEFTRDPQNRLVQIQSPAAETAVIPAGVLLTPKTLLDALQPQHSRVNTFNYGDNNYSFYLSSIVDDRGATNVAFVYGQFGRLAAKIVNGNPVTYQIIAADPSPQPLPLLDPGNLLTRVVDRDGNIKDYESHGPAGGPLGGAGRFGLRRVVNWTETGKGNPALRNNEPAYWEQRWLHDCDCLSPIVVTQPFSSLDKAGLGFDAVNIPTNWPREILTYNSFRQPLTRQYTDGTNSIRITSTYQPQAYGVGGQYSLKVTEADPRAFDLNPIYAGLNFTSSWQYDAQGNMVSHAAPAVTRGVPAPQLIVESWTYNSFGQVTSHSDPNGNITRYTYYAGPSTGGDINTQGTFGGYLSAITRGGSGSTDPAVNLTEAYKVNSLGLVTQRIDPMGHATDYIFDDLKETVAVLDPWVTLRNGVQVRYSTTNFYDGAGYLVLKSRSNIDFDGSFLPNPYVATSWSFDAVGNRLAERREVDNNLADDLITSFGYDPNDQLAIIQKPAGNRTFHVYDERHLLLKTFHGVAASAQINSGYPALKQALNLGATGFVGYTMDTYDARMNEILTLDGRGYLSNHFFDFRNRPTARVDPNGNGTTTAYDAAGNVITKQAGVVSRTTGAMTQVLSRTYQRVDEASRQYKIVMDLDLSNDESTMEDPGTNGNPSYITVLDPDSRVTASKDANGNSTTFSYDAANRQRAVMDALGNSAQNTYDPDGNVVALTEIEVPGPGAIGAAQSYVTTFAYDENDRRTNIDIQGLNGNSINDQTSFAFDSRGNPRLTEDADGNFTLKTLDDQSRTTLIQRFDSDPTSGKANLLSRTEHVYDLNSRKIEDHSFSSATNLNSVQITRYAYDNADRLFQTVYPDSNSVELTYDANSNPVTVEDQRQVVFNNTFDPGNRWTGQSIVLTNGVSGVSQQQFVYDARNLLTGAMNNYASVNRGFDALGRMTNETQSIRLDGSGFANGWEQPVSLLYGFDLQSNQTNCLVVGGTNTDLSISRNIDALNRNQNIDAQYFNISNSPVATYHYFGPGRIQTKILGNGAQMTNTFDAKRRVSSLHWLSSTNRLLVGFQYGYDSMDKPQYERWLHDNGFYDYYQYNHRYEVTGVAYRTTNSAAPVSFPTSFAYNDNLDRSQATFGGSFSTQPTNVDAYTINTADQYTGLTRNGVAMTPSNDRAGNMTNTPALPVSGVTGQLDVNAAAAWDAFNGLFSFDTGVTPVENYRYDPFHRRIATLSGLSTTPVRRFIYDGWSTIEERLFNDGATPASAPSALERIYVDGARMDEHLLTAIDRDNDGSLGPANLNRMDIGADQWYYFLPNRVGSVMALLAANDPNQTLEYYRYTAYGEVTVLPIVDNDNDGYEDTPLDLSDNFAQAWQRSSPEHGNFYFFTGQRFDDLTGLYYFRNRYYEGRMGRFVQRDPSGYRGVLNAYQYALAQPLNYIDPLGLVLIDVNFYWIYNGYFGNYYVNEFSYDAKASCVKGEVNLDETFVAKSGFADRQAGNLAVSAAVTDYTCPDGSKGKTVSLTGRSIYAADGVASTIANWAGTGAATGATALGTLGWLLGPEGALGGAVAGGTAGGLAGGGVGLVGGIVKKIWDYPDWDSTSQVSFNICCCCSGNPYTLNERASVIKNGSSDVHAYAWMLGLRCPNEPSKRLELLEKDPNSF